MKFKQQNTQKAYENTIVHEYSKHSNKSVIFHVNKLGYNVEKACLTKTCFLFYNLKDKTKKH